MKLLLVLSLALTVFVIGCNSHAGHDHDHDEADTTVVDTTTVTAPPAAPVAEQLYACPMHPEVTGKKDEKCSKCGMKLTEPVKTS